jgi:hypothetical protein
MKKEGEIVDRPCCDPFATVQAPGEKKEVPGGAMPTSKAALGLASEAIQGFHPLKNVGEHVCAFHFYSDDMTRQLEAHHYCSCLNDDFRQCLIYDSDKQDAKLIGIEYIISEKLFAELPEDEKKLWHSHVYEVTSGTLVAPRLPTVAEKAMLKDLIKTYGKTWHTWQVDRYSLPLGEPKLMYAFTEDGQLNPSLVEARDKRLGISTADARKNRTDLAIPVIKPGADSWKKDGSSLTTKMVGVQMKMKHSPV